MESRRSILRLLSVIRRQREDRQLDREIASHLALLQEEYERRGMAPVDARRAARIALGGVEQTKELHRDARSFVWLDDARRDLAHAIRLLRRNPAFTATAVLSLAIGIGANTSIFTVANAVLLRDPAGVAEPDRLVEIGVGRPDGGLNPGSYPAYRDVRDRTTTLSGVYAHDLFPQAMSFGLGGGGADPENIFGHYVTPNFFTVLGAKPAAGRLFGATDSDQPGASPIVVLSHDFWLRRFNQDPSIVGATIRLNRETFTVVGVASAGFQGTGILSVDVWVPLSMLATGTARAAFFSSRDNGWLVMGGRLTPGVSIAEATQEVDLLGRALNRQFGNPSDSRVLRVNPSSRVSGNRQAITALFTVLMVIVSLVLAVACANVAGMLLARGAARRREIAVRLAIGAGRARLIRQLMTETIILFALGAAGGVFVARVVTSLVSSLPALPFPVTVPLAPDGRVIVFTTALSLVAALLSGLSPALQASRADVLTALKDDSHASSGRSRLRGAFVVSQVAFSLVLVVVAGLFVKALEQAGSRDPGFDPKGVELASIDLEMGGYPVTTGLRFWRELTERVRQLPSVQAASVARVLPGGFEGIGLGGVTLPGQSFGPQEVTVSWNVVEPGYFDTLRIPIVDGRDFNAADLPGSQLVVIVSERLARTYWPDGSAIGRPLAYQSSDQGPSTLFVVGVARELKSSSLIDGVAGSFVYLPLQQHYQSTMTITARTTNGQRIASDIRTLVASMDDKLTIVSAQTLEDSAALGLVPQRVMASFSGSLGTVGLLLAAIGIYGVTSFTVARRTREIGIRIALGARPLNVVGMVIRQGFMLALIGSVIGLTLASAAARVFVPYLFDVAPFDVTTFAASAVIVLGVGLAASYVPARRATAVDPVIALHQD